MHTRALSVAALVELERTPRSGGHVKCWERLAQAATEVSEIDLTVYVLGRSPYREVIGDNARFVGLRPMVSTGVLCGLVGGVDRSDLTPYHPQLARALPRHDVWHLTHSFAFANTALRVAARHPTPLVASVHTDVPTLTALYTQQVAASLPRLVGIALQRIGCVHEPARIARRRRDKILGQCDRVLVSNAADEAEFSASLPTTRLSRLRRGIDRSLFRPIGADRTHLADAYDVPIAVPLVLFVGRIDDTKGAGLLAHAVDRLRTEGLPAHLVLVGEGAGTTAIARRLGSAVSVLGHLPQSELPHVYAGCDVVAFPSRSETAGNVVAEAMAMGRPVVLPINARTGQWLAQPGSDGVLVERDDPHAWAAALKLLLTDPLRRARMGRLAHHTSERMHPSWLDVLREDLVPVWLDVSRRAVDPDSRSDDVELRAPTFGFDRVR